MKTLQNILSTPKKTFKVTKHNSNNYKTLLPNILYQQMESYITELSENNPNISNEIPKISKLKLLKNAYLNDKLSLKVEILDLNNTNLNILLIVKRENKSTESIICKAIYKLHLNETISKAS